MIHDPELRPSVRRIVRVDGRLFRVKADDDRRARAILERKVRRDGVIRDETYWHANQRLPVAGRGAYLGGKSVVCRVLDAAGATYDHLIEGEEPENVDRKA